MVEPDAGEDADWFVMESTYGDRLHPEGDPMDVLMAIVRRTVERKGVLLVPAFAVGRAQAFIYYIDQIFDRDPSLRVPLYLDSPMATDVTKLYLRHAEYHRLSSEACAQFCREAKFIRSREESMELNKKRGPFIIIASSGMLTGGRILHHLRSHGGRSQNTILIGGYQAPGTRGADLLAGKDDLKIHGRYYSMRAEVVKVNGLSAHGDQKHLLEWLEEVEQPPTCVFLVHGEHASATALAEKIDERYGWNVSIPQHRESVKLTKE
jgi:metallo-beta-lactamase family protein